jgi:hypothetical protein
MQMSARVRWRLRLPAGFHSVTPRSALADLIEGPLLVQSGCFASPGAPEQQVLSPEARSVLGCGDAGRLVCDGWLRQANFAQRQSTGSTLGRRQETPITPTGEARAGRAARRPARPLAAPEGTPNHPVIVRSRLELNRRTPATMIERTFISSDRLRRPSSGTTEGRNSHEARDSNLPSCFHRTPDSCDNSRSRNPASWGRLDA